MDDAILQYLAREVANPEHMTTMTALAEFNWWAAMIAAFGYYLLGALWFTPLFGKAWDRSIGYDRAAGHGRFPLDYYVVPLIGALVGTLVIAVFTALVEPADLVGSAAVGLGVGAAIAGATLTNALTPHTPKPYLFAAITAGYHLVGCTLAGLILGAFAG
jgi:MFS family permease